MCIYRLEIDYYFENVVDGEPTILRRLTCKSFDCILIWQALVCKIKLFLKMSYLCMSLIKKYNFLSTSYNIMHFKVIENMLIKGAYVCRYLKTHLNKKVRKWLTEYFLYFLVYFFLKLQVSYVISFNLT